MRSVLVTVGSQRRWTSLLAAASAMLALPAVHAQQVAIEQPGITRMSSDHGPASPEKLANITVHLKMRNEAAFSAAVDALYQPGSPTYHHWMTGREMAAYAPSPGEVASVKKALESQGLQVLSVSADNLSIRARGPVRSMENAFQTQIHEFERDGKTFSANATPARLAGAAGDLVSGVTGISELQMRSYAMRAINPRTGQPLPMVPLPKAGTTGFGNGATSKCFSAPIQVNLTTAGASLPKATYSGNAYTQGDTLCGWGPAQIRGHYGMEQAHRAGLDGQGQSIVLVEGPTDAAAMLQDLATFDKLGGVAAPASGGVQVLYPDGKPSPLVGYYWQGESDLDLQWAHAIAPQAKIVVLIMPSQDWTEFEYAIQYAVDNKLGNVISNSYGLPEYTSGAVTIKGFNQVIQYAAAKGIAVNFSSGDAGDEGTGAPDTGGVSFPADSPYTTAVGGTSLGVPKGTSLTPTEVGWGNNQTLLSYAADNVLDPPAIFGFVGGSGGGQSTVFAKPSWQNSVPGANRQVPDIAAVADPYTGALFVQGGKVGTIGGTSLSCPIFSAIWTLANQQAGVSLGQAAPLLAVLSTSTTAIRDVLPPTTPTNVAGTIVDAGGTTSYSPDMLMAPLYTTTEYTSALWEVPTSLGGGPGEYVSLSFGTDTSLETTVGWDNVTGWGVPGGFAFIQAAAALK